MMELKREQIIKAMECCYANNLSCIDCPFQDPAKYMECTGLTLSALSLIKELTEENERLKSVEFTCGFVKPHKVLECPIFDEIANAKADTIMKMHSMLCEGRVSNDTVVIVANQIKKEMLEEVTTNGDKTD